MDESSDQISPSGFSGAVKIAPKRSALEWVIFVIRSSFHVILGFGPSCRFTPTCSHFAVRAVENHGVVKGCWLSMKRLVRCHPWGGSGWDLVPRPLEEK